MPLPRSSMRSNALRQRSIVPARHVPSRRTVAFAPSRRMQRVSAASMDPLSAMAQELLEKEEQLRAMFESGKKMPRAAVVAELRKEIAQLRSSLQGAAESGALPRDILAASAAPSVVPTAPAAPAAVPSSIPSTSATPAIGLVANESQEAGINRAHQILMEVEAKLKVQQIDELEFAESNQHPHHSASRISVEMARLEAENKRLRRRANALLSRQAALEDVYLQYMGREWVPAAEQGQQELAGITSFNSSSMAYTAGLPAAESLAEAQRWVEDPTDAGLPSLSLGVSTSEDEAELSSFDASWLFTEPEEAAPVKA